MFAGPIRVRGHPAAVVRPELNDRCHRALEDAARLLLRDGLETFQALREGAVDARLRLEQQAGAATLDRDTLRRLADDVRGEVRRPQRPRRELNAMGLQLFTTAVRRGRRGGPGRLWWFGGLVRRQQGRKQQRRADHATQISRKRVPAANRRRWSGSRGRRSRGRSRSVWNIEQVTGQAVILVGVPPLVGSAS